MSRTRTIIFSALGSTLLASCAPHPVPKDVHNVCSIFIENPTWYWSAKRTQRVWGVSVPTQMAFMYQESHFNPDIRPPRRYLLGFIPWKRKTTAFGYAQALDGTWRRYQFATRSYAANRDRFSDASDFIGWYGYTLREQMKLNYVNAKQLYLAYHEGMGGFKRKTYLKRPGLVGIANRVQSRANTYAAQLKRCAHQLPQRPWYQFW